MTTLQRQAMMSWMLLVLLFQLSTVAVQGRSRIRKEPERNRDRIGGGYKRPDRNNGNNNNNNSLTGNRNPFPDTDAFDPSTNPDLNLVLVPQCNPANADSYYRLSQRPEYAGRTDFLEDTTSDCDRYVGYCDKKRSNLAQSWDNYVFPDEFYQTVELLYDRCFKTCAEALPGGIEEFCAMPDPVPDNPVADFNSGLNFQNPMPNLYDARYCLGVDGDDWWTPAMEAHEQQVLEALNAKRGEDSGQVCTRRMQDPSTGRLVQASGFFPRSSPVVTNDRLRCAARIQAQNIVLETLENNRFPSNLHKACPSRGLGGTQAVCEDFSTRMEKAGYGYSTHGFGYINEVTAAGYKSAEQVIAGWLSSKSGHCEAIVKQESLVIPTEVGIGYYRDEATGMTGHVMLLGQRELYM